MFFVLSLYSCLRRRPRGIIFQMYDFLEEEEDPGVDIPAVRRGANFNCRDKTWENGKSASIRRRSENLLRSTQYLINRMGETSYCSVTWVLYQLPFFLYYGRECFENMKSQR